MTKDILDQESKIANATLISKNSEKMAISKNPDETRQDLYKRLGEEKLKDKRVITVVPKEEKRLTKQELKNLTKKCIKKEKHLNTTEKKWKKSKLIKRKNQKKK